MKIKLSSSLSWAVAFRLLHSLGLGTTPGRPRTRYYPRPRGVNPAPVEAGLPSADGTRAGRQGILGLTPPSPWSARQHEANRYSCPTVHKHRPNNPGPTLRHEYSRPNGGKQQLRRGVAVPQVTPQARRAQKVMPVELLTSCLPGVGTLRRVHQRPNPVRSTPRRSPTHRQTARTATAN